MFQVAVDAWSELLISTVPISIRVSFLPLRVRGLCIPNPIMNFPGARENTWYPASLADATTGRDVQPGQFDMEIFFSTNTAWHYDRDSVSPPGKTDFLFVAAHEICHGLGFASLLRVENGVGSFGRTVFDHAPSTSFPLPDLAGFPSIFDRFIENEAGQRLVDAKRFPNPSRQLGAQLSNNRVFFGGRKATRRNRDRRPRLHGSDPSHLDPNMFHTSTPDGMMTPGPGRPMRIHAPGPVVIGVLEDLGWKIVEPTSHDETR